MPGAAWAASGCWKQDPWGISCAINHWDAFQTQDLVSFSNSQVIKSCSIPVFRLSVQSVSRGNMAVVKTPVLGSAVLRQWRRSVPTLVFGSNPPEHRSQIALTTSGCPYI